MQVYTSGGWLTDTSFPNEYVLVLSAAEAVPDLTPIAEIGKYHYYATLIVDETFKWQYAAGGIPLNYEYSDIAQFLEPFLPYITESVSENVRNMSMQENTDVPAAIYKAVCTVFKNNL